MQFFLHCSFFCIAVFFALLVQLQLRFLRLRGEGQWFGVECDGHDYDDDAVVFALQLFLHCSLFCIEFVCIVAR